MIVHLVDKADIFGQKWGSDERPKIALKMVDKNKKKGNLPKYERRVPFISSGISTNVGGYIC